MAEAETKTLTQLRAEGVTRVRRPEWAFPGDHIEMVRLPDGFWGPWATLHSPAFANTDLAEELEKQKILLPHVTRMWGEDGWVAYQEKSDG